MSVCTYCGRGNEPGAQFCVDCGKPLTKAAAFRQAAAQVTDASQDVPARDTGTGPGPATSVGPAPRPSACPHCGAPLAATTPRTDLRLTLVRLDESGREVKRFPCQGAETTIGREDGDVRFPDDPSLSPLHARLSWEDGTLLVRDLGSRNGTWAFLAQPHRLVDGDVLLIGSQLLRFRRLGYPGPHAPEADATQRTGSLAPRADIARLTQLRADGSPRDTIHLSPGRDIAIGRERGDWTFPYDPAMSAQHALVRSEDADFVILDQNSRNGIALATRGAMPLGHGSKVLVGNRLLRVELPA